MTTWRLFYENRFPSNATTGATILDVQRAAAGTLTIQTGPVFTSSTGSHGFGIGSGRNLTYRPTAALNGIIGLDVSMELGILRLVEGQPIVLWSTDGASADVTPMAPAAPDGRTPCRLTVRVGNAAANIDGVRLRRRSGNQAAPRHRLQVRWTTNGQLHLFVDGQLAAYENAAAPGFSFGLARWSVGNVDGTMTGLLDASVTGVRVVELREESAAESFGEALDPLALPEIGDRCLKVTHTTVHRHLREARALMARFNQSQTAPWRAADGGSPFTPAAVAVHQAGGRAGVALGRYLREGTDAAREQVVTDLGKVLTAIAADQPDAFKALVTTIRAAQKAAHSDCYASAEKIRAADPALFKKLDPLHDAIEAIVASLGA
jgi:hypothetical protein